jgi:hypothetical protein
MIPLAVISKADRVTFPLGRLVKLYDPEIKD